MGDRKKEEVMPSVVEIKEPIEAKETKKKFYEEKWFWVIIAAIVALIICRPTSQIVICGNGNGTGNNGDN